MKKTSLLLLLVLFLAACGGAPSEDDIYEDVISILEEDLPGKGILPSDFSSKEMTEFEDMGDGLYQVNGNIDTLVDGMYSYSMKIKYDGGEWIEYEWVTQ